LPTPGFNCSTAATGIEFAALRQILKEDEMKAKTIAITLSLVFVSVALGFQDNPQLGTWKLNEAKSKFAGKTRNHTVVYEAAGDQIKVTVDGVDESGNATHNEWTGKFDGKDYPVTGDASGDTRSYRTVNNHTLELTNKKGGKTTLTGRIVVSADGKTRTVTTNTTDAEGKKVTNVAVYDKQ
jgi:hypothetical protein